MSFILDLEPKKLWKHFDELRKIPRPSGNEQAAGDYVIQVARSLDCKYQRDKVGNVVVYKPASPGHEKSPTVVLQSHLDMVCEKNSDKVFDFEKDAIQLIRDGEWLKADGTTLGADNGIGVATILAIFEDNSLVHGPLEGVFTIDEERGLNGAMSLSSDWLKGRVMINLDSEEIGVFSIGCAGGRDANITLPVKRKTAKGDKALQLHLQGLRGGHSGIDIHEGRGNAIKILNRLLYQVQKTIPVELACFYGGDKHNAIPREAFVQLIIQTDSFESFKSWMAGAIEEIKTEFSPVEKDISLTITEIEKTDCSALTSQSQDTLLALLFALPHGPLAMSRTIENLVETSNNVAALHCKDEVYEILCSSRSSNDAALRATLDKIVATAGMTGATVELPPGYPGWMPDVDSEILKLSLETYKEVTKKEAKYMAIHAGLECGLIGEKFPGMDMISIGPTLLHPHSPDERVQLDSVKVFYDHVIKILERLV